MLKVWAMVSNPHLIYHQRSCSYYLLFLTPLSAAALCEATRKLLAFPSLRTVLLLRFTMGVGDLCIVTQSEALRNRGTLKSHLSKFLTLQWRKLGVHWGMSPLLLLTRSE